MDARTFAERLAGMPDQARNACRLIAMALGDAHPWIDNAVLLGSETATNAVRPTDSAQSGGGSTLTVEHTGVWPCITIRDDGSLKVPCLCPLRPIVQNGIGASIQDDLPAYGGLLLGQLRNEVWSEVGR
jgi:serine/threonine-protein kinase RsbW